MAKKTTKKVVAKPVKKTAKVKSAPLPKASTNKLAGKKTTSAKVPAKLAAKPSKAKAPVKALKAEAVKPTKASKEAKLKPEPKVQIEAPPEKPISKPVSKKNVKSKVVEVEEEDLAPAQDSVPSRKGKKYEGATEEESKWLELRDKNKNIKPRPYKLSETYEEKTPIEHKVLGWGIILSVVNDRLEVLFRSGIKHLISNYKPNS